MDTWCITWEVWGELDIGRCLWTRGRITGCRWGETRFLWSHVVSSVEGDTELAWLCAVVTALRVSELIARTHTLLVNICYVKGGYVGRESF